MLRLAAVLALGSVVSAQWPDGVEDIRYQSAADKTRQQALFYKPESKARVPLLVGLHTWSSNYKQTSSIPYAEWCIARGWAFIHPNFRGPNSNPTATGSELAVADIVSAVDYAKANANIDADRVYLIGASGGGYATLLLAGRHPRIWAGVSAWVPISDLAAWHAQCKKAGRAYWTQIEKSCGGAPGSSDAVDKEYQRRSAMTWIDAAIGVHVDINAGIHDGHTGSVPISHSLLAFNALAARRDRFTPKQIAFMVGERRAPQGVAKPNEDPSYGKKQPLVRRTSGTARITIFDGGHEGIPTAGLTWLSSRRRTIVSQSKPWRMHTIDGSTKTRKGADGVRLGDANGDGLLDTVTGWEEGHAIRVCLNPGGTKVTQPWPAVTVGEVTSAEDAVFADLDGDGNLDVVSCTEGRTKTVYFHWAPKVSDDYLDSRAWRTVAVPATEKKQAWMFALPMDIDGVNGIDLILGSKGKGGTVGWLRCPKDRRDVAAWTFHKIVDAGWIMSLRSAGKSTTFAPVWVTDRKGKRRGVYRLEPVRRPKGDVEWARLNLDGAKHEVMFMDLWRSGHPLVATRNGHMLDFRPGAPVKIPNPFGVRFGKAVCVGDLDGDGELDIVHTANTGREKNKPGICWLKKVGSNWQPRAIGGPPGTKFDRIELVDLDRDGDLDVMTCEENAGKGSRGLGVVWYENPGK